MAQTLTLPMLILQGERDYQVTIQDFQGWQGVAHAERRLYPGLNHLFISGTAKSLPAEYNTPGHVTAEVVKDIAIWIKRQ